MLVWQPLTSERPQSTLCSIADICFQLDVLNRSYNTRHYPITTACLTSSHPRLILSPLWSRVLIGPLLVCSLRIGNCFRHWSIPPVYPIISPESPPPPQSHRPKHISTTLPLTHDSDDVHPNVVLTANRPRTGWIFIPPFRPLASRVSVHRQGMSRPGGSSRTASCNLLPHPFDPAVALDSVLACPMSSTARSRPRVVASDARPRVNVKHGWG
ncbi:hypothetical protein DB88DRAFT_251140 [Papiliotrema laurentii]|uniref:Uncharacterized protein n=1 Tax=Papiliotrema laurentii TaxID=5418 RepID=A0AAD9FRX7_PAPLA|nr:hypothetical protein DB88DRAFT_251140 [Papiliotrema laurentii]